MERVREWITRCDFTGDTDGAVAEHILLAMCDVVDAARSSLPFLYQENRVGFSASADLDDAITTLDSKVEEVLG